jgi:hypothetical protein
MLVNRYNLDLAGMHRIYDIPGRKLIIINMVPVKALALKDKEF